MVVIAPSHFENFHFSSIYDGDAYATPLGNVPVDQDFRAKLAKLSSTIKISDRGHLKVGENAEHALEVQLPWLQRTLGEFKLVPIIMGDQDYGLERALGRALAKALLAETPEARAQTLILVSSDLSHYHPYDYANNVDHQTLQAIEDWDYLSLSRNFAMWQRGVQTWEACGGGPIVAGMIAAEGLGATHAQILKYANTGDATGDKTRVVGYGAVAITGGSAAETKKSAEFSLTSREKNDLITIARASVETAVRDLKMYLVGATHAQILKYANSGDATGDKTRVVGYGAVAITRESAAGAKKSAEFSLAGSEKNDLMRIARASVETAVRDRKIYLVGATSSPRLEEARGAFVTLKEHGELRGCIGYITPMKSLAETVRDVASYAALEDSRFTPVTAQELPLLEYEISVMSPLRRVLDIKEIKVGKHGLIMKQGDIEGVLLPQVPVEEHWSRDTFIEETCLKAGLPRQAWKDDDTDIFMFTALVFGEHSPTETALPDRPAVPGRTPPPSAPGLESPRP